MVITDVCLLLLSAVTMIVYPSCPNFLYNFVPSLIISYYIIMPIFCRVFVKMCVQTDSCERDPNSPFKKIDIWCFGIWGQMLKNISIHSNQDCNDSQRGKNLLEVVFSHSKSPNDKLVSSSFHRNFLYNSLIHLLYSSTSTTQRLEISTSYWLWLLSLNWLSIKLPTFFAPHCGPLLLNLMLSK